MSQMNIEVTELRARLEELEANVGTLKEEMAELRVSLPKPIKSSPTTPPTVNPVRQEGVAITTEPMLEHLPLSFRDPSHEQYRELYGVGLTAFPKFGPKIGPSDDADLVKAHHFESFCEAFKALALMRRTATPDIKRYVTDFIDEATRRYTQIGRAPRVDIGPGFMLAVLAHGDIAWTNEEHFSISIGLSLYGDPNCAGAAWKDVLIQRRVLAPVASGRPRVPPAHRTQIFEWQNV